MKKTMIAVITVAVICVIAIPVFGSVKGGAGKDPQPTASSVAVERPNPFIDCETLEDASKLAGFDLVLPESVWEEPSESSEQVIRVMQGEMIEVIDKNASDEIRIRKAGGTEDISGVFNTYAEESSTDIDGRSILMKGNDGKVSAAIWTDGTYTYSVYAVCGSGEGSQTGIEKDHMLKIVKDIQ